MSAFSTLRQRPYKRDPERLQTITTNITRCLSEMIVYKTHHSAQQELAESLDDYARYIIAKCREVSGS